MGVVRTVAGCIVPSLNVSGPASTTVCTGENVRAAHVAGTDIHHAQTKMNGSGNAILNE